MKAGRDYVGVGVGVAIWNEDGKVLLMKRGRNSLNEANYWALPGGMVDFGEKLRDAAIREIREEIGVDIKIANTTPAYDHILPDQHWVTNVFEAKIVNGTPMNKEPDKCEEIGWFSLDALPSPIAKMSEPALEYFKKKK